MEAATAAMIGDDAAFGHIDNFFDFAGDDDDDDGVEDDVFVPMEPQLLEEDLRFLEAGLFSAADAPLRRPKMKLVDKLDKEQQWDWFNNVPEEIADPFSVLTAGDPTSGSADAAACGVNDDDDENFRMRSPVSVLYPGRRRSRSSPAAMSSSCSAARALGPLGPAIPARPRSKRPRRAAATTFVPFIPSSPEEPPTMEKEAEEMLPAPVGGELGTATRKCMHCEMTKTPQWRAGPMGPRTLCNACGVRYKTGRLFPEYRPAASPTFVAAVHSNSHKKVVAIRNKRAPGARRSASSSSAAVKNCELIEYIRKH